MLHEISLSVLTLCVAVTSAYYPYGYSQRPGSGPNSDQCLTSQVDREWSYGGLNGPANWCYRYSQCCGRQQSPININTYSAIPQNPFYQFKGLEIPMSIKVDNVGTSVEIHSTDGYRRELIIGNKIYQFDFIDIHGNDVFNGNPCDGTSHSINNQKYALEVHVVFSYNNPLTWQQEMVGVAIFLDSSSFIPNGAFSYFFDAIGQVPYNQDCYRSKPSEFLDLKSLMSCVCNGNQGGVTYEYAGSYAHPPCTENVKWIIAAEPCRVAKYQLEPFYNLRSVKRSDGEQCAMYPNYREQQNSQGRAILSSRTICATL